MHNSALRFPSRRVPALAAIILAIAMVTGWQTAYPQSCNLTRIGQPTEHSVRLTANQPGVRYDQRTYKYYVEWRQSVSPDSKVIVQAFSRDFQPITAVRDGASGRIVATGRPQNPLIEDNGIWWYDELDFTPRRSGTYQFILSTQNINQGELAYTVYRYGCRGNGSGGGTRRGNQGGGTGGGSGGGGSGGGIDGGCGSLGQRACGAD